MVAVALIPIDADNWRTCVRLKVAEHQEEFVASNVFSLAQSKYEAGLVPLGVEVNGELVGFVMYNTLPDARSRHWIYRVMIDIQHQGHGYGRATMIALIKVMTAMPDCREIVLDFHQDNANAEKLYASLGFHRTGEVEGDEVFSSLVLAKP